MMTPTEQQENEIREAWNNRDFKTTEPFEGFTEDMSSSDRMDAQEFICGYLSGHAAAMQKREEKQREAITFEASQENFKVHDLKCWPPYFREIETGKKTFELRKNDRDFQVGDVLFMQEWCPEKSALTGHIALVKVSSILKDAPQFGVPEGFCIMSIYLIGNSHDQASLEEKYIKQLQAELADTKELLDLAERALRSLERGVGAKNETILSLEKELAAAKEEIENIQTEGQSNTIERLHFERKSVDRELAAAKEREEKLVEALHCYSESGDSAEVADQALAAYEASRKE